MDVEGYRLGVKFANAYLYTNGIEGYTNGTENSEISQFLPAVCLILMY